MRNLAVYKYINSVARTGSIRKAAESLSITPSALNRRILAFEDEVGMQIFERLGRGVRLNTAGEILIDHFRRHLADTDRVMSQLSDLSGLRSGVVNIVCGQALLPSFLPCQILRYQKEHSAIDFGIQVRDDDAAANALQDYSADLALVFKPLDSGEFQTIMTVRQPIFALMSNDHPLADHTSINFSDCLNYPLALPSRPNSVRTILDDAASRMSYQLIPTVEAESSEFLRNYVLQSNSIAFEIEIGVPPQNVSPGLSSVPLNLGKKGEGALHLAQLRGRTLPIASAKFSEQLTTEFETNFHPF